MEAETRVASWMAPPFAVALVLGGTARASTVGVGFTADPFCVSGPTVRSVASSKPDGTVESTDVPPDNFTVTNTTRTGAGW